MVFIFEGFIYISLPEGRQFVFVGKPHSFQNTLQ